jgi:hypothetical protein
MRNALALVVFLVLLAFAGLTRASFDSGGQPSVAKTHPAPQNKPVGARNTYELDRLVVLRLNFVGVEPVKFVVVPNPPPAKKPIRPRPFRK